MVSNKGVYKENLKKRGEKTDKQYLIKKNQSFLCGAAYANVFGYP